jgi:hypothetical protein
MECEFKDEGCLGRVKFEVSFQEVDEGGISCCEDCYDKYYSGDPRVRHVLMRK